MRPKLAPEIAQRIEAALRDTTDSTRMIALDLGVSQSIVQRIASRSGITNRIVIAARPAGRASDTQQQRPMPADFAERAATASNRDLGKHYKARSTTIARWRKESGVAYVVSAQQRSASARLAAANRYAKTDAKDRIRRRVVAPRQIAQQSQRDMTLAARAADECLQRLARTFRCDEDGRANPNGTHWTYGRVVLTPEELVERAERKGWRSDAWKQVAA